MESRQSNSSSAEAKHLGPEASADELARAVDRSLCEGIMTDCFCEPAMPAWSVRRFYRLLITPMAFSRRSRQPARSDPTHATWLANVN